MAPATARRVGEIGFAIGAAGALLISLGALTQAGADPALGAAGRRMSTAAGGLLMVVCFVMEIVNLHWS